MKTLNIKIPTIDDYLLTFPEDVRAILQTLRQLIRNEAPGAQEVITYGIPTFRLNGNLVHFAGYKSHIGFYPAPSALEKFKDELSKYEVSKGTVRFPLDKPLPLDLIKKMVQFRVRQQTEKGV